METMISPTQRAWESLANVTRLYVESKMRFHELFQIDREEAINNQDMAMEAKLEKFHALYDVTKEVDGFHYLEHADTALLIILRNAIHHRDHSLFHSWNARLGIHDGFSRLAGTEFLLGSTTPEEDVRTARFYYLLDDFYCRLERLKNAPKYKKLWEQDLSFSAIAATGREEGYHASEVYVDVMPAYISAMHRVRGWLASTNFVPCGDDGKTYFRHFGHPVAKPDLSYKRIRIPDSK